jgi:hypothetical protein
MAKGDNPCIPLYYDSPPVTGAATAAIVGGRFVVVGGAFQSSPLFNASSPATDGGNIQITQAGAAAKVFGVAAYDAAAALDKIPVWHGDTTVVPMVAGGTVTAGQEVESDAAGKPITLASGKAAGIAESSGAAGATVYIRLT